MPAFVKDEKAWEKAKEISKKAGNKKGTQSFWKFANHMYFKLTKQKKQESFSSYGLGTQVAGFGSNGPTAYPKLMPNFDSFKKWIDEKERSDNEKMLSPIKKNKFDTTKEKQTIPGSDKPIFPKKDTITVWGAPKDYNYIRN